MGTGYKSSFTVFTFLHSLWMTLIALLSSKIRFGYPGGLGVAYLNNGASASTSNTNVSSILELENKLDLSHHPLQCEFPPFGRMHTLSYSRTTVNRVNGIEIDYQRKSFVCLSKNPDRGGE